jgi:hypothetical protein
MGHRLSFLPVTFSFRPKPDGRYLLTTGDEEHDRSRVAKLPNRDWAGMAV